MHQPYSQAMTALSTTSDDVLAAGYRGYDYPHMAKGLLILMTILLLYMCWMTTPAKYRNLRDGSGSIYKRMLHLAMNTNTIPTLLTVLTTAAAPSMTAKTLIPVAAAIATSAAGPAAGSGTAIAAYTALVSMLHTHTWTDPASRSAVKLLVTMLVTSATFLLLRVGTIQYRLYQRGKNRFTSTDCQMTLLYAASINTIAMLFFDPTNSSGQVLMTVMMLLLSIFIVATEDRSTPTDKLMSLLKLPPMFHKEVTNLHSLYNRGLISKHVFAEQLSRIAYTAGGNSKSSSAGSWWTTGSAKNDMLFTIQVTDGVNNYVVATSSNVPASFFRMATAIMMGGDTSLAKDLRLQLDGREIYDSMCYAEKHK